MSYIPLSAYVEVDSSLVISERISGIRCQKIHHYSVIPFLIQFNSIQVYLYSAFYDTLVESFYFLLSELTEIKTSTGITLEQSLHVACVMSIGSPSWFKTEIFPTSRRKQSPLTPPVSKMYRTVTPLCRIEPNCEFCEPLHS